MKIQFRLRYLIFFLVILCILVLFFGIEIYTINKAYQQELAAVKHLEDYGFRMGYSHLKTKLGVKTVGTWIIGEEPFRRVSSVDLIYPIHVKSNKSVNREVLQELLNLKKIIFITINRVNIDDTTLEIISSLPNLEILNFSETNISDSKLIHLQEMKTLTNLTLFSTNITDDGIKHLVKIKQLNRLVLGDTKVTNNIFNNFNLPPNLQNLVLCFTAINDKAFTEYKQVYPTISHLDVGNTTLTDEGLLAISKVFPNLVVFKICNTKVTLDGLQHIKKFKKYSFFTLIVKLCPHRRLMFQRILKTLNLRFWKGEKPIAFCPKTEPSVSFLTRLAD